MEKHRDVTVAQGWAIETDGELSVRSVSPTPLGAKVNWLMVDANVLVLNSTPDAEVDRLFKREATARGARLREVSIAAKERVGRAER